MTRNGFNSVVLIAYRRIGSDSDGGDGVNNMEESNSGDGDDNTDDEGGDKI